MRPFLTARWRYLALLNYRVDPAALAPFLPSGTELDAWEGRTLVSLVGFRFESVRLGGIAVPFHTSFDEINLRFYVRGRTPEGPRRGVVFVREIVPLALVTAVANARFGERYVTLRTRHELTGAGDAFRARYGFRSRSGWNTFQVESLGPWHEAWAGSQESFLLGQDRGFARAADGSAREYRVEHARWRVRRVIACKATLPDAERVWGPVGAYLKEPLSATLAEGSDVKVFAPR